MVFCQSDNSYWNWKHPRLEYHSNTSTLKTTLRMVLSETCLPVDGSAGLGGRRRFYRCWGCDWTSDGQRRLHYLPDWVRVEPAEQRGLVDTGPWASTLLVDNGRPSSLSTVISVQPTPNYCCWPPSPTVFLLSTTQLCTVITVCAGQYTGYQHRRHKKIILVYVYSIAALLKAQRIIKEILSFDMRVTLLVIEDIRYNAQWSTAINTRTDSHCQLPASHLRCQSSWDACQHAVHLQSPSVNSLSSQQTYVRVINGESKAKMGTMMRWRAQDEVKQEDSEQDEVDGTKEEASWHSPL